MLLYLFYGNIFLTVSRKLYWGTFTICLTKISILYRHLFEAQRLYIVILIFLGKNITVGQLCSPLDHMSQYKIFETLIHVKMSQYRNFYWYMYLLMLKTI